MIHPADDGTLQRARRTVVRSALTWTPLFVLFVALGALLLVRALTQSGGAWVGFAIVALIALLASPLAFAALRDLRAEPIETEGTITRKWSKADLIVFRGHYLTVGKRVFRVRKDIWLLMPEVFGRVHVRHFPHTNTLIAWEALASAPAPDDPAAAAAGTVPPAPVSGWVATPAAAPTPTPLSLEAAPRPARTAGDHAPRFGVPPAVQPPRFGPPRAVERQPHPPDGAADAGEDPQSDRAGGA